MASGVQSTIPLNLPVDYLPIGEPDMTENTKTESKLVWNVFDNEATILDVATGNYFSLDAIGTEVWQGLQDKKSPHEIARFISEKYGIDDVTAQNDVNGLIAEMRDAKIWS